MKEGRGAILAAELEEELGDDVLERLVQGAHELHEAISDGFHRLIGYTKEKILIN